MEDPERRFAHLAYCTDVKFKVEALTGQPCLVQCYPDVTRQRMRELNIAALLISGNAGAAPVFLEVHYCEVKELAPGFRRLAASSNCPLQAMVRHDRRSPLVDLVYPDGYPEAQPAGRDLPACFSRIAGIRAPTKSRDGEPSPRPGWSS